MFAGCFVRVFDNPCNRAIIDPEESMYEATSGIKWHIIFCMGEERMDSSDGWRGDIDDGG